MRLIKLTEVMNITSLARSTVYKYISDDEFPKPVSLGGRAVAWVEEEIHDWIEDKISQRQSF